ncbi:MAG: uroporphyrinogen-III C-methyltransferase [Desulfatirhabdiaceae bacterium]
MQTQSTGKVYLVGAGPGDPGLITLKGIECLKAADVVIYDYLASPQLLGYVSPKAESIYVGKKGGDHTLPQQEINQLILEKARSGLIVTRLKGGDPFIFGRGGEEAELLIEHGIPVEIVPGVTSAVAAPAYAGIPLTHRDYTATVAFVTGHEDPTKAESKIDWPSLAQGIGTLVFFMGVKNLPNIVGNLMKYGKPEHTPVALIQWGTTYRQKTVTGTLATIVDAVRVSGIGSPSIIVVGEVVGLRNKLKWFEDRPLMGKTVVVTRAREQASDLVFQLSGLGANCIEFPVITISPPEDWIEMDRAIDNLPTYDWLIFTSVNGVKFFFDRLFEKGLDSRSLGRIQTAVIGPATAEKLLGYGVKSDIVPESFRAESIIEAFSNQPVAGKRILLPRAGEARSILPEELTRMGAQVDDIAAYHTHSTRQDAGHLISLLENHQVDIITFTSSSTVQNFLAMLPPDRTHALLDSVTLASIGPITTATAEKKGLTVHVTASVYTIPGLCQAIVDHGGKS